MRFSRTREIEKLATRLCEHKLYTGKNYSRQRESMCVINKSRIISYECIKIQLPSKCIFSRKIDAVVRVLVTVVNALSQQTV